MIVHNIEVHDVSTRFKDGIDVVAQAGKVGGEDRWGDDWFHSSVLLG